MKPVLFKGQLYVLFDEIFVSVRHSILVTDNKIIKQKQLIQLYYSSEYKIHFNWVGLAFEMSL